MKVVKFIKGEANNLGGWLQFLPSRQFAKSPGDDFGVLIFFCLKLTLQRTFVQYEQNLFVLRWTKYIDVLSNLCCQNV